MYDSGVEKVKSKIQVDAPTNVSLQMDGWTAAHHGYMGGILGTVDSVNYSRLEYYCWFVMFSICTLFE